MIYMAERNSYHVVPGDDGWKAEREGSARASSVHDTQAAAIDAARGYLSRSDGGELNIHGKKSQNHHPTMTGVLDTPHPRN